MTSRTLARTSAETGSSAVFLVPQKIHSAHLTLIVVQRDHEGQINLGFIRNSPPSPAGPG